MKKYVISSIIKKYSNNNVRIKFVLENLIFINLMKRVIKSN
jgi:hypothetical protein